MNGKPDEYLDEWVRQSLDRLPDALPPGTRFDAERLWTQLRPELQKPATHRWPGWVWWAAAGCVVGTLLGWFMMPQPDYSRRAVSRTKRLDAPVAINAAPRHETKVELYEATGLEKVGPSLLSSVRHSKRITKVSSPVLIVKEPAQPATYETDLPVITETPSPMPVVAEPAKVIIAAVAPKRRFRVVHLNELQAEEAIRPSPHRADRFVRLGTSTKGQPAPETDHPTITWPLTTKSNL